MRQRGGDAVRHHVARFIDILRAAGEPADHKHEAIGAQSGGLIDGALVVVDRRLAVRRRGCRKETAAAKAGELDAVLADDAHRLVEPHLGDLIAPGGDRGDAVFQAEIDRFGEATLFANGREVDGEIVYHVCQAPLSCGATGAVTMGT